MKTGRYLPVFYFSKKNNQILFLLPLTLLHLTRNMKLFTENIIVTIIILVVGVKSPGW